MHVRLWDTGTYGQNGGWITFNRENIRRFDWGVKDGYIYWWAIFGFTGLLQIFNWPWQRAKGTPR